MDYLLLFGLLLLVLVVAYMMGWFGGSAVHQAPDAPYLANEQHVGQDDEPVFVGEDIEEN